VTLSLIVVTIVMGVLTGMLSATMGVGGGIVVIPFMLFVLESSQHVAEGTSLVVIVPTALAATVAHLKNRLLVTDGLWLLIGGGVLGAVAGALVALQMDAEVLQKIYAALALYLSYRFLFGNAIARRQTEGPG